ncbi:MAG TPA: SDR family oxidoreductase, partial [Vicinamibacteria bacterium]|nr:SDR family oxidoreductase [Vicinamibacteria bacterium]
MRVLFLGGTGNISTACVELALACGHQVGILTRGRRPCPPAAEAVVGDRDDPVALRRAADGRWDAVADFLAYTPAQVETAIAAFAGRTGQYVFIGTAAAYDKRAARLPITEDAPLANPFWEYARLKIACEETVRAAHRDGRLSATIVRPSYTYGPTWIPSGFGGQDYTVVDRMRRGLRVVCHGDGTALWVMTHASDFACGFVGLLGHSGALGEVFHITSDEVLTWDAIYETIARAAGAEARLVHVPSALIAALVPDKGGSLLGDKAQSTLFDNAKVRSLVPEFRPRVGFAEGIARSIAWFDADPSRRVVSAAANEN